MRSTIRRTGRLEWRQRELDRLLRRHRSPCCPGSGGPLLAEVLARDCRKPVVACAFEQGRQRTGQAISKDACRTKQHGGTASLARGHGRHRQALQANDRLVWLEVLADNERAIRAYRACGFVEEGRLRQHARHDGTYKDIVVMGVLRDEWLHRVPNEH